MSDIRFSVIIPAYNEAERIQRCIESVLANKIGNTELIVVDNGSTDETVSKARLAGAVVIENDEGRRRTIARLRNLGASRSAGQILAFLDADMIVPANWLEAADRFFRNGLKGAIAFADIVPEDAGWVGRGWWDSDANRGDSAEHSDFLAGRNLIVDRQTFDAAGGFDESLTTCEDKDLSLRIAGMGLRTLWVAGPCPVHLGYDRNLLQFARKEFWRQGSTLRLAAKHGFSFRTIRNPLLSAWHACAACLSAYSLFFGGWALASAWVCAWLLPSIAIAYRKKKRRKASAIPLFLLLTFIRWNVAAASLTRQLILREWRYEKAS